VAMSIKNTSHPKIYTPIPNLNGGSILSCRIYFLANPFETINIIIKIIKEIGENKGGIKPLKQPAIIPNKALE
jgi:hypothetical protein